MRSSGAEDFWMTNYANKDLNSNSTRIFLKQMAPYPIRYHSIILSCFEFIFILLIPYLVEWQCSKNSLPVPRLVAPNPFE